MVRKSQPSGIDQLAGMVHPRDGHHKIFVMLDAYLDESGIHEGAPVCVVAGYCSDRGNWKRFQSQWKKILKREGIKEFHAKVFWKRAQPGSTYYGWSNRRRKRFEKDLLDTIVRNRLYPVSSVIVIDDWNKLSHDERRYLTGGLWNSPKNKFISSGAPSKPYYLPFQFCVVNAVDYCKNAETVHFFFDLNNPFKGYALDVYATLKEFLSVAPRMGEIAFPTGLAAVQLQAADLFAFQSYLFAQKRLTNPTCRMGPVLRKALRHYKDAKDFQLLNKTGLLKCLEKCPEAIRSDGASV